MILVKNAGYSICWCACCWCATAFRVWPAQRPRLQSKRVRRARQAGFSVVRRGNFFSRQAGATVSTLGRAKSAVLAELAADINPEIDLREFPAGFFPETVDAFLDQVDVYVDGLDFFAFTARRHTFAACEQRGIPVVTAAPLGMGTALLVFGPGGMPFEDYFGFEGCDELGMGIRFLVGLSPAMLQRGYVADMSRINLSERRGPSSGAACQLCAGVAAVETLKLLLGRGGVRMAPWGSQFEAYRMRYSRTWRPGG